MSDSSDADDSLSPYSLLSRRNTLVTLTRKFVSLIKNSNRGVIDLKYAANVLNVQKRRIYDITNVLEGIGLIYKKGHSSQVQWRGRIDGNLTQDYKKYLQYLTLQGIELKQAEDELDRVIKCAKQNLSNLNDNPKIRSYSYITRDDILDNFGEDVTLLTVKNYEDANLTADDGLIFTNDTGSKIDVRLVTTNGETNIKDDKFVQGVIDYYSEKDGKYKSSVTTTPTKRPRKSIISPKLRTYQTIDEAEQREDIAKVILKDFREDHSIWSRLPEDDSNDNDSPLLRIPGAHWDYKFSLKEDEGICELFDIPLS